MPSELQQRRVLRQPLTAVAARAVHHGDPLADPDVRAVVEAARTEAYAQGRRDGAADAHTERETAAGLVVATLQAAAAEVAALREAEAHRTVELAIALAEHLTAQGLADPALALAARVRASLAVVDDTGLTLRCAPPDVAAVAALLDDVAGLEVVADPSVAPGEGRLAGAWADADLTWRSAWDAVRSAVRP